MAQAMATAFERKAVAHLRRFPREPDRTTDGLRALVALVIRGLLRCYLRFEIRGRENLPNDNSSFVLVANHSSHLDSVCLLAALPLRRLAKAFPVAAEDYFFRSLARTWFAAVMMNALPFGRGARVRKSLVRCRDLLSEPGNVLIIFPEGTRSRTGEVRAFKPGVGALLAGGATTVLPCYIEGAFCAWPKGLRLPRPCKVRLIIGAPQRGAGVEDAVAISARLQKAVEALQSGDSSDIGPFSTKSRSAGHGSA